MSWMRLFYTLSGKQPVLLKTSDEYEHELATGGQLTETLAVTVDFANPEHYVSTVFLSMDHARLGKTPVLFETMVFPSRVQRRTVTYDHAIEVHLLKVQEEFGEARARVEAAIWRLWPAIAYETAEKMTAVGMRCVEQDGMTDAELEHELLVFGTSLRYERGELLPRRDVRERFPKAIEALSFAAHHFAVANGKLTCTAFAQDGDQFEWDPESGQWHNVSSRS